MMLQGEGTQSSKALRKSNSDMLLKFRRKVSVVKQTNKNQKHIEKGERQH